jgi:hypothetical protein
MIVNIEHMEATEREVVRSGEGGRVALSYTVSATIEVSGVANMGEAVRRIERRLQMAIPDTTMDAPRDHHAHVHTWADIPPLTSQLCSCGAMRRNEK